MSGIRTIQQRLILIDQSKIFQWAVIAVIIVSALSVGAKTHEIPSQAQTVLNWLDVAITVFFLIEILI